MTHPLHDSRLKLIRAEAHLKTFEREIDAYGSREPHALIAQYEPDRSDGPHYVFRLRIFESVDPMWGAIAGDFVHNVRSALDYLAWQLVILNNKTPNSSVQFPIFTTCEEFVTKGKRMVAKMNERHIGLLADLQPFQADRPNEAPLAILNRLSNSDKHRVLGAPLMSIGSLGWDLIPTGPGVEVHMDRATHDLWQVPKDNAVIIEVPLTVDAGASPKVYIDRLINIDVTLDGRKRAVETLRLIYEEAKRIVFKVFPDEFGTSVRAP